MLRISYDLLKVKEMLCFYPKPVCIQPINEMRYRTPVAVAVALIVSYEEVGVFHEWETANAI